jgi:hypothetical protein
VPFIADISIAQEDEIAIKAGTKFLMVVGRIQYYDDFGSYCRVFSTTYKVGIQQFILLADIPSVCSSGDFEFRFSIKPNSIPPQPLFGFVAPNGSVFGNVKLPLGQ